MQLNSILRLGKTINMTECKEIRKGSRVKKAGESKREEGRRTQEAATANTEHRREA